MIDIDDLAHRARIDERGWHLPSYARLQCHEAQLTQTCLPGVERSHRNRFALTERPHCLSACRITSQTIAPFYFVFPLPSGRRLLAHDSSVVLNMGTLCRVSGPQKITPCGYRL